MFMDETKRSRFYFLRGKALQGTALTETESEELLELMQILENEEHELLRPARETREAQLAETERQVVELRKLIARREALVSRLRRVQEEADAEREAINTAFHRLIGTLTPTNSSEINVV